MEEALLKRGTEIEEESPPDAEPHSFHRIDVHESPEKEDMEENPLLETQTHVMEDMPQSDAQPGPTRNPVSPQNEISKARQLYRAALFGNLEAGKEILRQDESLLIAALDDETKDSALHVAAAANQGDFVTMLLDQSNFKMDLLNANGKSAFCLAIAAGASDIAYTLLKANETNSLLDIRGNDGMLPSMRAALIGNCKMASDFYEKTKHRLQEADKIQLFFIYIRNDLFDLCLQMMRDFPCLQIECKCSPDDISETALHILARKPSSMFASKTHGICKQLINSCTYLRTLTGYVEEQASLTLLNILLDQFSRQKLDDIKKLVQTPSNFIIDAAESGNYEFLVRVIHLIPELIWERDANNYTIFHIGILKRHRNIFNLVYEMGLVKSDIQMYEDEKGNNIVHLAANLPPSDVANKYSGEYAQLKEEISWFKEMENFVHPEKRTKENSEKKIPRDVFFEQHKTLFKEGKKELTRKSGAFLALATLVLSLAFSAVHSTPGGNDNPDTHLLETILSMVNALAMCFSLTSVGAFISVIMSPCREEDFLESLPCRFKVGLVSLFITTLNLIVSFCAAELLAYSAQEPKWIARFTIALPLLPIILIIYLMYPLLFGESH